MKRVRGDSIIVHLLTLDGTLSVHATQSHAIAHYISAWTHDIELDKAFWKRFENAELDAATKSVMKKALKGSNVSKEDPEIDFGEYLVQCEDVCYYEQLEMEL